MDWRWDDLSFDATWTVLIVGWVTSSLVDALSFTGDSGSFTGDGIFSGEAYLTGERAFSEGVAYFSKDFCFTGEAAFLGESFTLTDISSLGFSSWT